MVVSLYRSGKRCHGAWTHPVLLDNLAEGDDLGASEAGERLYLVAAAQELALVLVETTLLLEDVACRGISGKLASPAIDVPRQMSLTVLELDEKTKRSWQLGTRYLLRRLEISSALLRTKRPTRACWAQSSS
jgi:hypothetical protein